MFGIFKKSPEKIADELFPIAVFVGEKLADDNHPQFIEDTLAHLRFRIGAQLFSQLMCQYAVSSLDTDRVRRLETCQILNARYLTIASQSVAEPVRVMDIVVLEDELENFRRRFANPRMPNDDLQSLSLPIITIMRELQLLRFMRMTGDMLEGAGLAMNQGPHSFALLVPACRSFVMQITADRAAAEDKALINAFAATVVLPWTLIHTRVQQAIK